MDKNQILEIHNICSRIRKFNFNEVKINKSSIINKKYRKINFKPLKIYHWMDGGYQHRSIFNSL